MRGKSGEFVESPASLYLEVAFTRWTLFIGNIRLAYPLLVAAVRRKDVLATTRHRPMQYH